MTTIEIDEQLVAGVTKTRQSVELSDGERLLDRLDEVGTAIPFRCRASDCASCLVLVTTGADRLAPPSVDELATLASHRAVGDARLACQIVVRAPAGHVTLVVIGARETVHR